MDDERREHVDGCTCDKTKGDYHPCPYDVDINNADPNYGTCDCCDACEYECARDI